MPISISLTSVLIWAVPLLVLGFLLGSGWFKKLLPTSGCLLLLLGWLAGILTLWSIALSFPIEFGMVILRFKLDELFGGKGNATTIIVNPWVILLIFIVCISLPVYRVYEKILRDMK